jgi:hypothetical protein
MGAHVGEYLGTYKAITRILNTSDVVGTKSDLKLILYGMAALVASILVWTNVFFHSDVIRVGNRTELIRMSLLQPDMSANL